jgi:hypothetical protein
MQCNVSEDSSAEPGRTTPRAHARSEGNLIRWLRHQVVHRTTLARGSTLHAHAPAVRVKRTVEPTFQRAAKGERASPARAQLVFSIATRANTCSGGEVIRWLRRLLAWTGWLAVCLLPCTRTAADDSESVQLSIPDCADASGAQIAQLVALELASRENLRLDASGAGLRASLRCSGDSAVINVRDPLRAEPLVLEMQLAQTRREARPRLLALAIAELIATSRLEHAPQAAPPAEPPEPALSAWLAAGLSRSYEPQLWSGALAAGAAHSFGLISLAAELGFDWTSNRTSAAEVRARALSLAVAPSLRVLRGELEWSVGLGLRAGYVWLQGSPRLPGFSGGSVSGAFVSPLVETAVQYHLTRRFALRASIELGYVVLPVRGLDADRIQLLEQSGVRATALLGLASSF